MATNRIAWIDTVKFVGIIAVILGHISSPLGNFIYSWHMPFFFILAGFFVRTDAEPLPFIYKEAKRFMLPYFIFGGIAIFVEYLKRLVLGREMLDWQQTFQGLLFWMDMNSLSGSYAFVLWFLPTLLFARYFIFLITKYVASKAFQVMCVFSLFLISFQCQLPFALDESLNAAIFVYLGRVLYRKDFWTLPFVLVLLIIYVYFGLPKLDMASKLYENQLINVAWAGCLSYLLISFFKKRNFDSELVQRWGQNTFLLFLIHPYTNNIASLMIDEYFYEIWVFKFILSVLLLQLILIIRDRFERFVLFRYV